MPKASSNAGLPNYLRPDKQYLFDKLRKTNDGIKLPLTPLKAMNNFINTEYKDKNGKDLYYKDEVEVDCEKFEINYNTKEFKWILINENKSIFLKEAYKKTLLIKKCENR